MQKFYQNKFSGVSSKDNLSKVKDRAYVTHLDVWINRNSLDNVIYEWS